VERVRWVDEAGIQVNAGHGLNYHNVESIAATPGVSELNIGHVIVARTLFTGLQEPVREMKRLMIEAHR
jgi:pyridoxine 5-phosphate synthase